MRVLLLILVWWSGYANASSTEMRPPLPPEEGPGVRVIDNHTAPTHTRFGNQQPLTPALAYPLGDSRGEREQTAQAISTPPADARPISVTDDTGRTVELAAPARRIVTLSPHATELVFAAGAGNRLVAVAPYSDYPPTAAELPTIGGLGGLDRERLLALTPDLVVAWDSGNRQADLAWLTDSGIALYRSEPKALDDIAGNLIDLGLLAGTGAQARLAAARYRQALTDACPKPAVPPLPAFIQLAAQPLLSVGGGHWLNQAIARAGLRNIYADLPGHALVVGEESLRAARPAVLLYLAYPGATPVPLPDPPLAIGLDPALWARPGPRLPAGIAALCRALPHKTTPHAVTSGAGM